MVLLDLPCCLQEFACLGLTIEIGDSIHVLVLFRVQLIICISNVRVQRRVANLLREVILDRVLRSFQIKGLVLIPPLEVRIVSPTVRRDNRTIPIRYRSERVSNRIATASR